MENNGKRSWPFDSPSPKRRKTKVRYIEELASDSSQETPPDSPEPNTPPVFWVPGDEEEGQKKLAVVLIYLGVGMTRSEIAEGPIYDENLSFYDRVDKHISADCDRFSVILERQLPDEVTGLVKETMEASREADKIHAHMKNHLKSRIKVITRAFIEYQYRPGGPGYLESKKHFETLAKSIVP